MKGVFRVKEQKKISLESLVSEIEKNGRIGRLGKVFKTEKNYYFYDKVLKFHIQEFSSKGFRF